MRVPRFVRPHLPRRDQEIEVDCEVFAGFGQEVVIDIGENAETNAGAAEALECGIRVGEWFPRRQAVREEVRLDARRNPRRRFPQDFPVRAILLPFNNRLDFAVLAKGGITIETLGDEGPADTAPPVDERAVTIESDDIKLPYA